MKITSKGQVTIPMEIRKQAGLLPNTDVEFVVAGKSVCIRKVAHAHRRGRALIAALRGKGCVKMTTDEIMRLTRGE
jgi:AbrB family looped-hinge helix DNA binding protein